MYEEIKRDSKGRIIEGSGGRPKGAKNKVTAEVKEKFQQLIDSYSIEQMKEDLLELEPVERLRVMTGLLDFFIPKLNRTDHALQGKSDVIIVLPNENRFIEPGTLQPGLPAPADSSE